MATGDVKVTCPYPLPTRKLEATRFTDFCHTKLGTLPQRVTADILRWLEEDIGHGDVTLTAGFSEGQRASMAIIAKQSFVLAGLDLMAEVFRQTTGGEAQIFSDLHDGAAVEKGQVVIAAIGKAPGLLLGERTALNLASKLSGIATKTKEISSRLESLSKGTTPALLETRKTTPGLRLYEKYATRLGGARNHRHGLDGGAMLKENHLRSIGNIPEALRSLKTRVPMLTKIEIEVTNLEEFRIALSEGADVIMLDNFSDADIAQAVAERNAQNRMVALELSGNLDLHNLERVAQTGVDFLSMGALIHKAVWVDMSMQLYL